MRFSTFLDLVLKLQESQNPGNDSHNAVMPFQNAERLKAMKRDVNPRLSAVAVIISPDFEKNAKLFLIERQTYAGAHSGQISFPGGKHETDDFSLKHTAIREAFEEIGIQQEKLTFIKELTKVYIPPSGFLMYPFMFVTHFEPTFKIDSREVKQILTLPLSHLLNDEYFEIGSMNISEKLSIKTGYFKLQEHKVWGATALVLNEIKELIKPHYIK